MKKNKLLFGAVLSLTMLASCKTSNTYANNAYNTSLFETNYFLNCHDYAKETGIAKENVTLSSDDYFGQDEYQNEHTGGGGFSIVKERYPEMFQYYDASAKKTVTLTTDIDWVIGFEGTEQYLGTSFGRTKCLGTADSSFKNDGVLSKLYNGQLRCWNYYAQARVQIDENGFETKMPKTMQSGKYFLACIRGGSNATKIVDGREVSDGRFCTVDLIVTLYKQNAAYEVTMPAVSFVTDNHGSSISAVGFAFDKIPGLDPKGITGYGVRFANLIDPSNPTIETDATKKSDKYFGLMLYEVMFPDATWGD
ncbi:MAG: hypothetical protein K5694_03640 [Bacilli bacterium]|nr:hypothetical protein [Bacilli bacterium]